MATNSGSRPWLPRWLRGAASPPDEEPIDASVPRVCIVTPVLNAAAYVDDAIASVVTQTGDFVLHYHIQDGGSTDGTVEVIRRWLDRQAGGLLPSLCPKLVLSFASAADAGLYDAVNTGFAAACPPGPDVLMGWLGADDRLAAGALATICQVRRDLPDLRFMGGRIALMNEAGCVTDIFPPHAFSRAGLAAGLHDGRPYWYVMQEGTFWCADLWEKTGGLDASFRLAGDWDLWRRMAAHAAFAGIDGLTGFHRKRAGQSSAEIGRYHEEVDRALARDGVRDRYEEVKSRLARAGFGIGSFGADPLTGLGVRHDAARGRWVLRID